MDGRYEQRLGMLCRASVLSSDPEGGVCASALRSAA